MSTKLFVVVVLFLTTFPSAKNYSQVKISSVGLNFGIASSYVYAEDEFYPYLEANVYGSLIDRSLSLKFNIGYTNDFVDEVRRVDAVTYSYSGIIPSLVLSYSLSSQPEKLPMNININLGLSHHFIHVKYVGGYSYSGRGGKSYNLYLFYFFPSIDFVFNLSKVIGLTISSAAHFPLEEDWRLQKKSILFFTAGIDYKFNFNPL